MPDFELGKSDWYTPLNVAENDFLNDKLENDNYGLYYSVRFEGDAETYLWQAKTAPVVGEKYFGHIEKSKSGKSLRFKKDKVPEGADTPQGANKQSAANSASTDENIARSVALKAAVDYVNDEASPEYVLTVAEVFLPWLQGKNAANAKIEGEVVDNEPLPDFPEDLDD